MAHPLVQLQKELDTILDIISRRSFYSLPAEETQSLIEETTSLSQKLTSIESSFLTIGLLGGTGVGKSTLMNALAGSRIASTSHRRPHTDDVLVYRHVGTDPPPALASTDVPLREITHEADSIQQILLCDLPDFDSLMGEHREHVLDFLEHLDVLIWVTSPEKYGDGRFYEFLGMVPKASQNFCFVLNKMDLLFQGVTHEKGYEQLERVITRFQTHIKGNGVNDPLLYALSAQEAIEHDHLAPWNQFLAFKRQVFQQRDVKQITAIKADNLDVEVRQLFSAFHKEVRNLKIFEEILENSIEEIEEQRPLWIQAGQEAVDLWIGKQVAQEVLSHQSDPSFLVGPGHGLSLLLQEWKRPSYQRKESSLALSSFAPPEEITTYFQRRLEWIGERVNHRVLQQNLPSPFRTRLGEVLDATELFRDLGERLSQVVSLHVVSPRWPSFRGFKTLQYCTYLLILLFFILTIDGEAAWKNVLENPGGMSVLRLLLSGIHTLFSAKGLAALLSYALLNLFLAFRFYRHYSKRSQRAAQRILVALKAGLQKAWEEKLDSILDDLNRLREEIRSDYTAISSFGQEGTDN